MYFKAGLEGHFQFISKLTKNLVIADDTLRTYKLALSYPLKLQVYFLKHSDEKQLCQLKMCSIIDFLLKYTKFFFVSMAVKQSSNACSTSPRGQCLQKMSSEHVHP